MLAVAVAYSWNSTHVRTLVRQAHQSVNVANISYHPDLSRMHSQKAQCNYIAYNYRRLKQVVSYHRRLPPHAIIPITLEGCA